MAVDANLRGRESRRDRKARLGEGPCRTVLFLLEFPPGRSSRRGRSSSRRGGGLASGARRGRPGPTLLGHRHKTAPHLPREAAEAREGSRRALCFSRSTGVRAAFRPFGEPRSLAGFCCCSRRRRRLRAESERRGSRRGSEGKGLAPSSLRGGYVAILDPRDKKIHARENWWAVLPVTRPLSDSSI